MKHTKEKQASMTAPMLIDRDLLASYLRNKMNEERISLRKAAEFMGTSPATLSRLLSGGDSQYTADTSTLNAAAAWLKRSLSDFESTRRPSPDSSSLAQVEMHLHALPDITDADARAMMAVIQTLYEQKRRSPDDKS
jgi:transcriptional regulator with XRE-family HTH domain